MTWVVSFMQHHPALFLGVMVGVVFVGVYTFLLGLCMAASHADRQIDRMRRERREETAQGFYAHGLRKVGD